MDQNNQHLTYLADTLVGGIDLSIWILGEGGADESKDTFNPCD